MATTTVNPAVLNALTIQYGRTRNDLDTNENRLKINYNSALDKMKRTYDKSVTSNYEGLADRGMIHSGAGMKAQTDLRGDYDRSQATMAETQNLELSNIAKQRLLAQQEFDTNTLLAKLGYTTGS